MWTLTAENAVEYLHFSGQWPPHVPARACVLSGGVSAAVIRVVPADSGSDYPSIVLKQAAPQLRTRKEWFSRLDRIWNEAEAMRFLAGVLPPGVVPAIHFEDRDHYLIGMTDLGPARDNWKLLLLEGRPDVSLARTAGLILGTMHEASLRHAEELSTSRLADWTVFDELRIDPYYRTVASVLPIVAEPLEDLMRSMRDVRQKTFVHADFSPKNILVGHGGELSLVDFETAHWGDPAFDLGFFMTHLMLKTFRANRLGMSARDEYLEMIYEFWAAYRRGFPSLDDPMEFERRTLRHLAGCMLARVDGKSPVDYLAEPDQDAVRVLAIEALRNRYAGLSDYIAGANERFRMESD
ncbi:phosphotransferase [bacterium]|nr:phosphotransferase [bacterium]